MLSPCCKQGACILGINGDRVSGEVRCVQDASFEAGLRGQGKVLGLGFFRV